MIAHIVCFKMKNFALGKTKEQNLSDLKKRVETLPKEISVIRAFQFEFNKQGKNYDAVLVELFEDDAALNIYDNHPVHLGVKEYIGQVCDEMAVTDHKF